MARNSAWPSLRIAAISVLTTGLAGSARAQTISFVNGGQINLGTAVQWVSVGDFNGDGIQDLAAAQPFADRVSVLLGNGDGTFQAPQNINVVGTAPHAVAVGDFNGDGKPDLVTANGGPSGTPDELLPDDVSVLLGNGDGTFQAAQDFP